MPASYTTQLAQIYGPAPAARLAARLQELLEHQRGRIPIPPETRLSERDAILISYPDQLRAAGQAPLKTLRVFCENNLQGMLSGIHLLPFYPWSSDDGFSVKDHRRVEPGLGSWQDVERLGRSFRLMIDGVVNHASAQGSWFKAFLRDQSPYRDYFLTVADDPDLSAVMRPRSLPLLTNFETSRGVRRGWTTFGPDQVDLDYHNPDVLLEMLDILLIYAGHGAQFIRLDAIAYLWKEIGTPCINLPQTHAIVQLLRSVLAELAPHVRLVTEANIPHAQNLAYFGDGGNEAQLVYNFALPPLILHTFRSGDAGLLSAWAAGLVLPSPDTTFFNFLASHDGIGLNPVRDILAPADIQALIAQTLEHGGLIGYRQAASGAEIPYELNINFFDALSDPAGGEPVGLQVDRFMAAQAILLCLQGMPGIYFHSLFGSRNWTAGVQATGNQRAINRQKLLLDNLQGELADPGSLRSQVFQRYRSLLALRSASSAFHPNGGQEVLELGRGVFAIQRSSPDGSQRAICLQNVTATRQEVFLQNTDRELGPFQSLWLFNP